jgi:phage baseplate assembly protein V
MAFEKPQILGQDQVTYGMIRTGRVTKVRTKGCVAASVTYPHLNIQTAYIQVLQRNTLGCQDFYVPEIGENVWVLHPPDYPNRALILGSTYTVGNPPPYDDKAVRGVVFADGTYVIHDTRGGGNYQIHTGGQVNVNAGGNVNVIAGGNAVVQASGTATVTAPNITLQGNVKVQGNLLVTGTTTMQQQATATPRCVNTDGSGGGS